MTLLKMNRRSSDLANNNIKIEKLRPLYKATEHRSFRDLLNYAAETYGDKTAFIIKTKMARRGEEAEYREVSFTELSEDVMALGTAMLQLGLSGSTVSLIGINSYNWVLGHLATVCGIGTIVPLDKGLPYVELRNSIEKSRSSVLIFDKEHAELAERIAEDGGCIRTFICMDDIPGYICFDSLLKTGRELIAGGNTYYLDIETDPEEARILIFTSGTTSSAKAVMLSQRNIMKNIYALELVEDIRRGDVNMAFLPYHHTFGSTGQFLMLAVGATTVYCDGLKYVQKNLQEYGVSVFVGVPLIVESLYKKVMAAVKKQGKEEKLNKGIKLSNFLRKLGIDKRRSLFKDVLEPLGGRLRLIVSGASALDPTVSKTLDAMGITVIQGYGMTECSPVIAAENLKTMSPGSIGLAIPGTDIEIDSPDENGVGELIVRSPSVMSGYFENEEATSAALKDGWLHTGDLAYKGKGGCIFLCGRSKNMIVLKNGKKVFPEEVEELIAALPYVRENIVYGEKRKEGADDNDLVMVAKIVYDPEYMRDFYRAETPEEVHKIVGADIERINLRMPKYKSIIRWIVQTEEMIKTTTGKVKRFEEIGR